MHKTGLVVNNEFSFLGVSPNGLVCDGGQSGLIEIKCPYTARNMSVDEACQSIPGFYLQKGLNDNISLSETQNYYAQVQGQLMVTGCKFCDFIVLLTRTFMFTEYYLTLTLWGKCLNACLNFTETMLHHTLRKLTVCK